MLKENKNKEYQGNLVPALSNETWELLEFRMWSKFSNKLWAIVGSFLTIVTVVGLLGLPTYISSKIEKEILNYKADFEKLKTEMAVLTVETNQTAKVALYLSSELRNDLNSFLKVTDAAKNEIEIIKNDDKTGNYKTKIDNLIMFHKFLVGLSLGSNELVNIPYIGNKIISENDWKWTGQLDLEFHKNDPKKEWKTFEKNCKNAGFESLYKAAEMLPHLIALNNALHGTLYSILVPDFQSQDKKEQFLKIYESVAYPNYSAIMNKANFPYSYKSELSYWGWSTLQEYGNYEFISVENAAKEKLKKKRDP